MLKRVAKSQITLSNIKITDINDKLGILAKEKSKLSLKSDKRIRIRYNITQLQLELQYWKGSKNTAEIFLDEIIEQEKREQEDLEEALSEAPTDLSFAGGPVTGNIE